MNRKSILTLLTLLGLSAGAFAAPETQSPVGIVNFSTCIAESKLGKQEQASFESLKNQMSSLLQDTEKQLNEISTKFNDPEYLDGLSPEAEEELKTKFRTLNDELSRYQNQYYQVLNQANMRIIQTISGNINTAAEKVAKEKKLSMVMNKDACFFYAPQLEITSFVISEMDKGFDKEAKLSAAAEHSETPAAKSEAKTK
jgi:outer membrane protein